MKHLIIVVLALMIISGCSDDNVAFSPVHDDDFRFFVRGTIEKDSVDTPFELEVGNSIFIATSINEPVNLYYNNAAMPAVHSAIHNGELGDFNRQMFEGLVFSFYQKDTADVSAITGDSLISSAGWRSILEDEDHGYGAQPYGIDIHLVNKGAFGGGLDSLDYKTSDDSVGFGYFNVLEVEDYTWIPSDGEIHTGFIVKVQFQAKLYSLDSGGISYSPISLDIKNGEANLVFEY